MKDLFVVRVPFKSAGKFYPAGTVLDNLDDIKLAKIKLNEQKIVPVPKEAGKELDRLQDWFHYRHKLDFKQHVADHLKSKGSGSAATDNLGASAKPPNPGTQSAPVKPLSGPAPGTPLKK